MLPALLDTALVAFSPEKFIIRSKRPEAMGTSTDPQRKEGSWGKRRRPSPSVRHRVEKDAGERSSTPKLSSNLPSVRRRILERGS